MLENRNSRPDQHCPVCKEHVPCRHRDFSMEAWSLLIACQEVDETDFDKPMCSECYRDLREILIDREDQSSVDINHNIVHATDLQSAVRKAG